jgi:hypothetical protein
MTVDRAYRQEGLSIGQVALRLGLPEYRLRQLINQGLGYRNFAAFLNFYRIADAREALADPAAQAEVPILTIALDAGFNSLGPFNRAFDHFWPTSGEVEALGEPRVDEQTDFHEGRPLAARTLISRRDRALFTQRGCSQGDAG